MMIRAAGGPGLISPLDYGERKGFRLNRNTWIAIGVVTLAHIGVGAAIYYQRFEAPAQPESPPGNPIDVTMMTRPQPPVVDPIDEPRPVPPNLPVHISPMPVPTTIETIAAIPGPRTESNTFTIATPVPVPTLDAAPVPVDPPRPPAVITRPRWASQPSAAQMERAFPRRALTDGIPGTASLNCLVSAAGTLSNCSVASETPRGQGFGRAASSLTPFFRMSPGTVDGQAIDGARVAFTVRFAVSE